MNIVFLLSSERSGSNLLTGLLNAHSQICGPSPLHNIRLFAQNISNYGNLTIDTNWHKLLEDYTEYYNAQLGTWMSVFTPSDFNNINQQSLESILKYHYLKELRLRNKRIIFIKENKLYQYFSTIKDYFPDATFVYLVRDPRDVVLSWRKSPNHPGGVIEGTDQWIIDQNKFLEMYEKILDQKKILIIKYEKLVSESKLILSNICEFLKVGYESKMHNFYREKILNINAVKIKNWENLSKPLMKNNFNKYLTELSKDEISYIEFKTSALMDKFGYKKSDWTLSENNVIPIMNKLKKEKKVKEKLLMEEIELRRKRSSIIDKVLNRRL